MLTEIVYVLDVQTIIGFGIVAVMFLLYLFCCFMNWLERKCYQWIQDKKKKMRKD